MFVGHTAVALVAKRAAPRTSLGAFVAAAFALDLLWPILLLAGLERVRVEPGNTAFTPLAFDSYPWSHSLVMAAVWGLLFAFGARVAGATARVQALLALAVVSHWVLDLATHGHDLPLWPGSSPRVGLGLWNSVGATLLIEGALFAGALALYVRATQAKDARGGVGFWLFVAFQIALWATQPWSPPPPDAQRLAWFALGVWLLPAWAWWVDRHRAPRDPRGAAATAP